MLQAAVSATIARAATPLVVAAEVGPAGTGSASAPRFVRVRGMGRDEFSVKCPVWSRDPHPYLCANEWIAGLVALQCGLPVLDMVVVEHPDCLAIGWPRIAPAMWATLGSDHRVLDAAENADILYEVVVFDALVRNIDRHAGNITARRVSQRTTLYHLFVYDHDRTLVLPGETPATLAATPQYDNPVLWIRESDVRRRITSAQRLQQAIDQVRGACSGTVLRDIVESTPRPWLPVGERAQVIEFLTSRASGLHAIVQQKAQAILPGLS